MRKKFDYSLDYKNLNLRKNPELYKVWKGEQWVLLVEPYKSEILPFWRFKNPEIARESSAEIKKFFYQYKEEGDFIGMDMARKFLQMWYTRSRRYANHKSGKKYSNENLEKPKEMWEIPEYRGERNKQHYRDTKTKKILPQEADALTNEKAQSARIFYAAYQEVKNDEEYLKMKKDWQEKYEICEE